MPRTFDLEVAKVLVTVDESSNHDVILIRVTRSSTAHFVPLPAPMMVRRAVPRQEDGVRRLTIDDKPGPEDLGLYGLTGTALDEAMALTGKYARVAHAGPGDHFGNFWVTVCATLIGKDGRRYKDWTWAHPGGRQHQRERSLILAQLGAELDEVGQVTISPVAWPLAARLCDIEATWVGGAIQTLVNRERRELSDHT